MGTAGCTIQDLAEIKTGKNKESRHTLKGDIQHINMMKIARIRAKWALFWL